MSFYATFLSAITFLGDPGKSLTFNAMTGIDMRLIIIVKGICIIFYTVLGGMEAVIWTEVIQDYNSINIDHDFVHFTWWDNRSGFMGTWYGRVPLKDYK